MLAMLKQIKYKKNLKSFFFFYFKKPPKKNLLLKSYTFEEQIRANVVLGYQYYKKCFKYYNKYFFIYYSKVINNKLCLAISDHNLSLHKTIH